MSDSGIHPMGIVRMDGILWCPEFYWKFPVFSPEILSAIGNFKMILHKILIHDLHQNDPTIMLNSPVEYLRNDILYTIY